MREYRGKRIDNSKWIYGSLVDGDIIVAGPVDVDGEYIGLGEWCSVDPSTVGQYTGLKDDQKKQVFDGDKVLCILSGAVYTVAWDDIGAGYLFFLDGESGIDYYEFEDLCSGFGYRVIGNVHDNPELLSAE